MGWEVLRLIFYLLVFIFIVWAAYYSSKRIAKYSTSYSGSKYMKIVDRMTVSKEAGLAIVKMGDKYLLISVTSGGVELLREFTEEEFEPILENEIYEKKPENPLSGIFQNIPGGGFFSQGKNSGRANKQTGNNKNGFLRFLDRSRDNDGEVLGHYDGDISDVENMDFNEILKRGISDSRVEKKADKPRYNKRDRQ